MSDHQQKESVNRRLLLVSLFIGTTIEWYDFLVFGFLGPVVFNQLFFPRLDPVAGTIAVFGIFWAGFLARPIGGIVFGHYGDRLGRKPVMIITLTMMGLATAAMGFLPTYDAIGVWAPVLVLVLRFLQGFALGGESTGAPVYIAESAPAQKRGLFASIIQSGGQAGIVLGTIATSLVVLLPRDLLLSWGWRIPFIVSLALALVAYYIRSKAEESPVFLKAQERRLQPYPLIGAFKKAPKALLIIFFCSIADSITPFFVGVFGINYAVETLHLERAPLLYAAAVSNFLGVLTFPLIGTISDRVGRRPVIATGLILMALYMLFAFFPLLKSGNPMLAYLALSLPVIFLSPIPFAVNGSFYAELFDEASYRFSGAAFARQLGTACGGGATPLIAASLLSGFNGNVTIVAIYYAAVCVIALIAVAVARETRARQM